MADNQNQPDPQVPASPSDQSASSDANRPDSFTPAKASGPTSADLSAVASAQEKADAKVDSDSAKSTSATFGDLLKDIKPEELIIQPSPDPSAPPPIFFPPDLSNVSNLSVQADPDLSVINAELSLRRQKANQARMAKRQARLDKLADEVKKRGRFTSTEAQEFFNLPQSTLCDYFQDLADHGIIKKFGKGRGMYYTI